MKRRRHAPEQVICKLAEDEKPVIHLLEPEPDEGGRPGVGWTRSPTLRCVPRWRPPGASLLARGELLLGRHGEWLGQHPRAGPRPP